MSLCALFQVKATCLSLQDANVLVQRNMLEILLYFFPFAACLVSLSFFSSPSHPLSFLHVYCIALVDVHVIQSSFFLLFLQDPVTCSVPLKREEMITVVSAASLTLLRRDMSLNRRLYAWLLGNTNASY